MTTGKRWLVSGCIGCVFVLLSVFTASPPRMQSHSSSFDEEKEEWIVSGSYRFTRLQVDIGDWKLYGLSRSGEYSLRIPDDGNRQISSTQYEDEAISQSKEHAGRWKINMFAVLLAIATGTITIRILWWLFQKPDNRTTKSTLSSEGAPSGER
ncbi:hypothetical protein ACFLS1_09250, partial [Verrucomicrobiota bacterium]